MAKDGAVPLQGQNDGGLMKITQKVRMIAGTNERCSVRMHLFTLSRDRRLVQGVFNSRYAKPNGRDQ